VRPPYTSAVLPSLDTSTTVEPLAVEVVGGTDPAPDALVVNTELPLNRLEGIN
jgi:hypothetical protein